MYRIIRCSDEFDDDPVMATDQHDPSYQPSYQEKQQLGKDLLSIVNKYFTNYSMRGQYSEAGIVEYSWYNSPTWTFSVGNSTRGAISDMTLNCDINDQRAVLNQFRSEIRAYLKSQGFTVIKFSIPSKSVKQIDQYGRQISEPVKVFDCIRFQ